MTKIKKAVTKFFQTIAATFKANYTKASYWAQIIGSVLVIGLAVATVFFNDSIDTNTVLLIITGVGSLLAFWGVITDNSILEDTGNIIKTKSNTLASTEQTVVEALSEAQAKIAAANSAAASQAAVEASQAVVAAYSQAASAAAVGDTATASSAATLASSLAANLDSNVQSDAETTSESASQAGEK
ncbi:MULTISPECIES: holin [Lactiplantibacillus]|uniref:holin n=1 Tax=Lactiplantibacillus TaxID=2767842 RepID=UPI001C1F233F|nr:MULTISPECIES: holin [Lactiplantibacillus]MBU7449484.1 holin [Lactiplantibacillus sp. 7.2.4]MBU7481163.1 holin [Lactiplantibacillus pentosus]MCM8610011.1 holin [Lactiplantibacillus sp. B652]